MAAASAAVKARRRSRDTAAAAATVAMVTVVLLATAAEAMARPSSRMDRVKENYGRVLALWRKGPQPRAIEVMEVLQGLHPSEEVHPRQTVLHRCDELACCGTMPNPQEHRCEPNVETVTLYFRATVAGTRRQRSIEHAFQNHTSCACVRRKEER